MQKLITGGLDSLQLAKRMCFDAYRAVRDRYPAPGLAALDEDSLWALVEKQDRGAGQFEVKCMTSIQGYSLQILLRAGPGYLEVPSTLLNSGLVDWAYMFQSFKALAEHSYRHLSDRPAVMRPRNRLRPILRS